MATALQPGTVEKTVTYKEIGNRDEIDQGRKKPKRPPLWEWMAQTSNEDWINHRYDIYLYRYNPVTEKRMAVDKIFERVDPFWIKAHYGGGAFNLMIHDDGELIFSEDLHIEGDPIIAGSTPVSSHNSNGGTESAMIQAMRMAMNPDIMKSMFEMFKMASMESMQMIRSQMPAPVDPLQTLRNAKEILGLGTQPANPLDEIYKSFMQAAIQKMLNPPETNAFKDTVTLINDIKAAGFLGGAPKADLTTTLVANLPMIADRFVSGLHEYRLQSESQERTVRLQRGEIRAGDPNVITIDPPPPANGATADSSTTPPAPQTQPQISPEVAQQLIMQADLTRLVNAMKQPECTGEDIYTFLSCVWPEMLNELSKFNKDSLLAFFRSREMQMAKLGNAILYEVGNDPRLPKMIEEFLAIAKAEQAPPAATV